MGGSSERAQAVLSSVRRGAAQARRTVRELTLRRRFNALAEELGQVVFRTHDGETGLDPEIERIVAEMRGVRAEIESAGREAEG